MSNYYGHTPRPLLKEEVISWMRDPRYSGGKTRTEHDPAYIKFVESCMELTHESVLGIPTPQATASPMQQYLQQGRETLEGASWQDPNGTLSQMNDVYRDYEEASSEMRSAKYKTSAFERQRVAEKLSRSTPDAATATPSQYDSSIQMMTEPEVHSWTAQQRAEEGN